MQTVQASVNVVKVVRVIAVSKNRNSFGLHGVVVLAEDGYGWEIAMSRPPRQMSELRVPCNDSGEPAFAAIGAEIPHALPRASAELVDAVFTQEATQ